MIDLWKNLISIILNQGEEHNLNVDKNYSAYILFYDKYDKSNCETFDQVNKITSSSDTQISNNILLNTNNNISVENNSFDNIIDDDNIDSSKMSSEDDLFIENMYSYNNFDLLIEKMNQLVFEDYNNIKEKNNIKILNNKIKSDSVSDDI